MIYQVICDLLGGPPPPKQSLPQHHFLQGSNHASVPSPVPPIGIAGYQTESSGSRPSSPAVNLRGKKVLQYLYPHVNKINFPQWTTISMHYHAATFLVGFSEIICFCWPPLLLSRQVLVDSKRSMKWTQHTGEQEQRMTQLWSRQQMPSFFSQSRLNQQHTPAPLFSSSVHPLRELMAATGTVHHQPTPLCQQNTFAHYNKLDLLLTVLALKTCWSSAFRKSEIKALERVYTTHQHVSKIFNYTWKWNR